MTFLQIATFPATGLLLLMIDSLDKNKLLHNYFSLVANQGVTYLLPLLTVPYLVRVLGAEKYGLFIFAQAFVQYFNVFTDFGFVYSAPRNISIHRDNHDKISELFCVVSSAKLILMFVGLVIFIAITWTVRSFSQEFVLFILSFLSVFGNILFPVWFFQGVEQMKYITAFSFLGRLLYAISIFLFVKEPSDYLLVPLFNGSSMIFVGILSMILIVKKYSIKMSLPSSLDIMREYRDNLPLFFSSAAVSLCYNTNTFLLGVMTNKVYVGYYNVGETLVRSIVDAVITPVINSVYPYVSRIYLISRDAALSSVRKVLALVACITFLISLLIFVFAGDLVHLIFGPLYDSGIPVLRILSLLPFLTGLSGVMAMHILLPLGMKNTFSKLVITSGIVNVLLVFILCPTYKHIGIAWAVLGTEIFATAAVFFTLRCGYRIHLFNVKDELKS